MPPRRLRIKLARAGVVRSGPAGEQGVVVNKSSRISRKKRLTERPALDADRRFAVLAALMRSDEGRGERSRVRRDGGDQDRSRAFEPPAADEGERARPHLHWQNLTFLLFIGCLIAAILFIVVASFITF
jgi:hypothetical protein